MGAEWAAERRAAGRAHRETYQGDMAELANAIGQPRCRQCRGFIEGELVNVVGVSVGSSAYHGECYERRWAGILDRLR